MIPICQPNLTEDTVNFAVDSLKAGLISSQGPQVAQFESAFAQHMGCKEAISVTNGTAALHLSLAGLGIQRGDEVIIPNLTFAATANAVILCGATPVLAESNTETWLLDPEHTESLITEKTKAIIPVHLYGQVADINGFKTAQDRGIAIIEDAAEAHGAKHSSGKIVGAAGTAGCFSFFANKLMTTGEGGMVTTNDQDLAQKYRKLRDHGMDRSKFYWHDVVGYNYRMTNIQAAMGLGQLKNLNNSIDRRLEILAQYNEGLSSLPIQWPKPSSGTTSVCWLATFCTETPETRDALLQFLRKNEIDARPGFTALSDLPPFKEFKRDEMPVSQRLAGSLISLPTYSSLESDQQKFIIDQINAFYKESNL